MKEGRRGRVLLERLLDRTDAFALSRYLDAYGIPVTLVEPPLRVALGEIPFLEAPAELVLEDPSRFEEANELILAYRKGPAPVRGPIWVCNGCGETHDPEFGSCWNCGGSRN